MKSINVEILMGHSIGVTDSYYRPKENEVLDDYLKASNFLFFGYDNITLTKHIKNLEAENKTNDYIIKGKLQEKDEEVKKLSEQFTSLQKIAGNIVSNLVFTKDQN